MAVKIRGLHLGKSLYGRINLESIYALILFCLISLLLIACEKQEKIIDLGLDKVVYRLIDLGYEFPYELVDYKIWEIQKSTIIERQRYSESFWLSVDNKVFNEILETAERSDGWSFYGCKEQNRNDCLTPNYIKRVRFDDIYIDAKAYIEIDRKKVLVSFKGQYD